MFLSSCWIARLQCYVLSVCVSYLMHYSCVHKYLTMFVESLLHLSLNASWSAETSKYFLLFTSKSCMRHIRSSSTSSGRKSHNGSMVLRVRSATTLSRSANEPRLEKTNVLHIRKQRRRSAVRNHIADQHLCFRYIYSTFPQLS